MKRIYTFALALLVGFSASAQKIKVSESTEHIAGASHNALAVTLYGVSLSDAEDAFRSFMKTYDGKRSSKNGEIFIDHATIKEMGNNTIDVYGKAIGKKGDAEIKFIVAFDLGGAYCSSEQNKDQYKAAEKIVKDFALKTTKDAIAEKLKAEQKVESKLEDDQKDLEKENKNLNDDIQNYTAKIKKAEDDIAKNKIDQEKKKAAIEAQKKVVADIDKKMKAVE
jgi:esterase/lipase